MAKPIAVQKLRHGKALCGKTFGQFVETFNWLVDFCLGLTGDKDRNDENGRITVDRQDPSAPVIRYSHTKQSATSDLYGCWDLVDGDLVNCYYNAGNMTRMAADTTAPAGDGIIYASINAPGSVDVGIASDLGVLNALQRDDTKCVFPLYMISGGEIAVDFRIIPHLQVFEGSL